MSLASAGLLGSTFLLLTAGLCVCLCVKSFHKNVNMSNCQHSSNLANACGPYSVVEPRSREGRYFRVRKANQLLLISDVPSKASKVANSFVP